MAQPRQPVRNQRKLSEGQKQATPQKQGKQQNQNKAQKEAGKTRYILSEVLSRNIRR
jgi:DNA-binding TFAR19-related protein (PDSD5 family)